MGDMIKQSIVNYHNQQFGDAIESVNVSNQAKTIDDIAQCRDQGWCPIREAQNKSSGYFLEFDVHEYPTENLSVDVFDDVLCISANAPGEDRQTSGHGKEFGMYQLVHLPKGLDSHEVSAYINHDILKVWIPRGIPLTAYGEQK